MSDEEKPKGDAGVTSHGVGDIEPVPSDVEFFDWLESLFDGQSNFPERLVWQVVEGPKHDRHAAVINNLVYPPKSQKPSREALVKLSNKILNDCQYDCDVQRRRVWYHVVAFHFSKSSDYYARRLIAMEPRRLGSGHPDPRESDEEEEGSIENKISVQQLKHQEVMHGLYSSGFEGMIDRQDRLVQRLYQRISELEDRIARQVDMIERLQSNNEERERRAKWDEIKIGGVNRAIDLVANVAPPMINQLMGKSNPQATNTLESLTLRNFLDSLSLELGEAIFGKGENGKCSVPGILRPEQSDLIVGVATNQIPVAQIDALLPGEVLAITDIQMMAIMQTGISMEQLMPIRLLFEDRQKRKQAMQPTPPSA